jgi:ribose/xylose/arabinose/galactoside ABC-type transport system permease subunit
VADVKHYSTEIHGFVQNCIISLPAVIVGIVFGFIKEIEVMFPVWFFIVLVVLIGYLLYITRPSEESISVIGKNQFRKLQQNWFRRS